MIHDWTHIINDQQNSGLTIKKYCELHHLAVSTFYKQKRKIINKSLNEENIFSSFEVVSSADEHISINVDGHTLVFDSSLLDKVIGALK